MVIVMLIVGFIWLIVAFTSDAESRVLSALTISSIWLAGAAVIAGLQL